MPIFQEIGEFMQPTILMIDDQADNLYLYKRLLQRLPFGFVVNTVCFTSAADALEWCKHQRPDICLVDYQMPEMDGLTFIRKFLQIDGYDGIPVFMVSAATGVDLKSRALSAGATDVIAKSNDPENILVSIQTILMSLYDSVGPDTAQAAGSSS